MKYDVQLTWQDVKGGIRLWHRSSLSSRFVETFIWIFLGFGLVAQLRYGIELGDYTSFFMMLAVFVAVLGVLVFVRRRSWRRTFLQNKLYKVPRQWEFTEEEWHSVSQHATAAYPWSAFHRWTEGPQCYLVYETDRQFNIIPKRIFAGPDESERLRAILQRNIGGPVGSGPGAKIGRAVLLAIRVMALLAAMLAIQVLASVSYYRTIAPQDGTSMLELSRSGHLASVKKANDQRGVFYLATGRAQPSYVLPSGPPVYVFNSSGTLIEWMRDSGRQQETTAAWLSMPSQEMTMAKAIEEVYGEVHQ
jgi:hypothetical protein